MVFADTGPFYARYRRDDEWHKVAVQGWKDLHRSGEVCVTTSYVVAEATKLIAWEVGTKVAAQLVRTWLTAAWLEVVRPSRELDLEGAKLMEGFADQNVSFSDCVSFATMRQRRLKRAFAFDKHFAIAGFDLWPKR